MNNRELIWIIAIDLKQFRWQTCHSLFAKVCPKKLRLSFHVEAFTWSLFVYCKHCMHLYDHVYIFMTFMQSSFWITQRPETFWWKVVWHCPFKGLGLWLSIQSFIRELASRNSRFELNMTTMLLRALLKVCFALFMLNEFHVERSAYPPLHICTSC